MRTLGAFGLQLAGVAAALAWHVALTNGLGAAESGTVFLAVSLATTFGVLTRFGGDTYLVSRVAQSVAVGDSEVAGRVYRKGLMLSVLAVFAVAILLLPFSGAVGRLFDDDYPRLLIWLAVGLLFAVNLFTLSSAALRGLGAAESSVLTMSVLPHLGAVLMFWSLGATTVVTASVALFVGWMAAGILGLMLTSRLFGRSAAGSAHTRTYLSDSLPLYQVAVAQMVINLSAPLFVGAMASPRDVALFTTAARIAQLVSLVQLAVNTISGPRIVSHLAAGNSAAAVQELVRSARFGAGVGLAFFLTVTVLREPILAFFGEEFVAAGTLVAILAAGQLLNVSAGCLGYSLLLTSHERLVQWNVVTFGALFILGALVGGWFLGSTGVALATAAALGFQNFALLRMARRAVPWLGGRSAS